MDDDRYRLRRRRRAMHDRSLRERNRSHGRRMAVTCVLGVTLTAAMLSFAVYEREGHIAVADGGSSSGCSVDMVWPIREPTIVQSFDGPEQPWLPGHRGVDLAAEPGTGLDAPVSGVIGFTGVVAGKSVVSITYGDLTLTFEPAVTDLAVGAAVRQGSPFATVSDGSDHCDGSCVHWGVRAGARRYLDPAAKVGNRRIALKPAV